MDWYYMENGSPMGPVSDVDLKNLFRSRRISGDTPVKRKGMADWVELKAFFRRGAADPPPAEARSPLPTADQGPAEPESPTPEPARSPVAGPPAVQAPPRRQCTECGDAYPEDDLIQLGGSRVCAACKPAYTQKLREGVARAGDLVYAGFWIRTGAKIIDGILVSVVNQAILIPVEMMMGVTAGSMEGLGAWISVSYLVSIGIPALYSTLLVGRYQATLGKMACGLKVVRPDGAPVGYMRALGRHFSEFVSSLVLAVGYLMVAFDREERRALHDRMCSTRVVRK